MPSAKRAPAPANSGWMTTRDAAEYLAVSEGHLRNLRSAGLGPPFHKAHGIVRYWPSDLDDWLAGRA